MKKQFIPAPDPLEVELLGNLRFCHQCCEWWPDDEQFFWRNWKSGKLRSPCKACIDEARMRNIGKPCLIEGCTETRCSSRHAYCREHHRQKRKEKQKEKTHAVV